MLPIIALRPSGDGGFYAAAVPSAHSGPIRPAWPDLAYQTAAAVAVRQAMRFCGIPDHVQRPAFAFVETDVPSGPSLGWSGFLCAEYPGVLCIDVARTPIEAVAHIAVHELGHEYYRLRLGDDGHEPGDPTGPSERFADWLAEAVTGPSPLVSPHRHPVFGARLPSTWAPPVALSAPAARTMLDGSITVTNAGAVVIIDGTSDMFKIAASGSVSRTWPAAAPGVSFTDTAIGALTLSTVPAMDAWLTTDPTGAANERQQGSLIRFVSPAGTEDYALRASIFFAGAVPGSPTVRFQVNAIASTLGAGTSAGLYYYVLKEAAI